MLIRPAIPSDAPAIGRVHVAAWQAAYRDQLPDELLDSLSAENRTLMWRRALERGRPDSGILVVEGSADDTAQIVGFASWYQPRPTEEEPDAGEEAELATIYLLPEVWGQGMGYALFQRAVEGATASGCTRLGLWVLDTNARGRRFYERAGMTLDPERVRVETLGGQPVREVRYVLPLPPVAED